MARLSPWIEEERDSNYHATASGLEYQTSCKKAPMIGRNQGPLSAGRFASALGCYRGLLTALRRLQKRRGHRYRRLVTGTGIHANLAGTDIAV